jgi:hypothetical protein
MRVPTKKSVGLEGEVQSAKSARAAAPAAPVFSAAPISLSSVAAYSPSPGGSVYSPSSASSTVAPSVPDPAVLEAKARHVFFIYDVQKHLSLSKEEFVQCWTEMPILDDDFKNQDLPEDSLKLAFDVLTRTTPDHRLSEKEFIAFFLKVQRFTLAKAVQVLRRK